MPIGIRLGCGPEGEQLMKWRRALAGVALGQLAAGLAGLGIAARKRVAVGSGSGTSEPVDRSSGVGLADKPRLVGTHAMIWAWRHSWCELESTSVPAAV
jgi:hypothetical protein